MRAERLAFSGDGGKRQRVLAEAYKPRVFASGDICPARAPSGSLFRVMAEKDCASWRMSTTAVFWPAGISADDVMSAWYCRSISWSCTGKCRPMKAEEVFTRG